MVDSPSINDVFEIEERLAALRAEFRGDILLPEDDDYDVVRSVWNGMIDRRPSLILRCTGTADVVAAVNFARENDMEVSIHGGGHNVAGKAVTDGGLMLDLSPMNGVRVDRENRTVRAQAGATLGDVDHETQLFGLATPLGAVTQTGIAGLTLNGGYGHLTREYGLACDALTEVDVVTADGQVLTASEDRNEDLFWAVRGGGGNFGVVTSFEYELHEVGPELYMFYEWFHADDGESLLDELREWTDSAPRNAGVLTFTAHIPELDEFPKESWGEPAVVFVGSYRGDINADNDLFDPLRGDTTPIADFSGPVTYSELQSIFDEDYPDGLRYYWKSIYLTEVTDEVIDLMLRYNEKTPSAISTIDLWSLGGAMGDVPQDATAFWHRDKPFMLNFEANWEDPDDDDANISWAREGIAELEELPVASGRYGNFPGLAEDPAELLFGDNYDRLVDIKTKYDPENLFRLNQNIAPRRSGD
ncbi:FAD-binding oxidoreductase [Haloarcula sp. JP-L23]|uniref:FAD-binding oxidoreductase n=1 Tax=Haloarcula sp. JP-L23 TaxID=2716717 RepID=UPI00140EE407|nr:FAD-binding oxidoreductase [Haloarcula sp. JP-L23]